MQHGVKRLHLSEQARKLKLEKDRVKVAHYRALTKKVLDKKKQEIYTEESLLETTKLLELNPEFNAVWNFRRNIFARLFETGDVDRVEALNSDLCMSMEMMKRYPKCYWIWNHRRWCLETLNITQSADWARELAIALKVLAMDSRNFHGWHYRRYVVSHIESEARTNSMDPNKPEIEIDLREFNYTTETINKSTSNFSAWHNRMNLIIKIFRHLRKTEDVCQILDSAAENGSAMLFKSSQILLQHELDLVKTGMFMDADDTSVWLYMQWLLTEDVLIEELSDEFYKELLELQLECVKELNALEKEDSPTGSENVWCLKTMIFLGALLNRGVEEQKSMAGIDDETLRLLHLLIELDPLRKGHYIDQLLRKASILY
ncbi:hypothetical protein METBIDRAFT_13894 [Metschnikowia bicuspidata var. bicuspidata NRRL YB-4993]|uniref:Geranylgeranyl transferase type-2 subunit alpha n=1 Tax=Metschnikowia bicuspidata var. bicuspidata NRRL YB-4993 TaxID=869754 RepID=A0A1A0H1Z4_9ASCO|nr:hypothetical protein METBIDRAFT_13894 [Metschnikowia bicuspidata var. bicuspidata NRRL YB-4993]OBA17978.1 hypothetical protein METBIDRAFT_13894 [Metschnikowia bicuspidata var. bicuspidata NRRL YB-4993]